MSKQTDNLSNLVKPYGLSEEEGNIYIYLLKNGFATALQLSRRLHLGRTKVYRLLDTLRHKQLVEFKLQERGMQFGATHPSKFQHLIAQREQEVTTLQKNLPDLITQLQSIAPGNSAESEVLYFEGVEGLKQVTYNITKAKGILRLFEMEHLNSFLPQDFAESIREELVANKITTRDLTNTSSSPGFTDVAELIKSYSQLRYIDPKLLKINFEVLIYNDVYATYSYKHDSIFCVEIHNAELAAMQKQLFDFVWEQAQEMWYVDERGAARLT
ncbi:MAG: hypothetical protein O2840_04085 [bacterium]|nr:hypothetical protein [bacterium]